MDKSDTYIIMCERATEIQEYWKQNPRTDDDWVRSYKQPYTQVWLPRQDQLQTMFKGTYDIENMLVVFNDWRRGTRVADDFKFKEPEITPQNRSTITMEQLWLKFVMYELFNKQWNPETKEWTNDRTSN